MRYSAFDRAIAQVRLDLRRGLWVLATTASTTPWLGLLATTIAIVCSFKGVTGSVYAFPSDMFEALADTLPPTLFGLLIAIPTCWIHHYLHSRCDALSLDLYVPDTRSTDFSPSTRPTRLPSLPLSAFDRAIAQVRLDLRRGLWPLDTFATISPWLGSFAMLIATAQAVENCRVDILFPGGDKVGPGFDIAIALALAGLFLSVLFRLTHHALNSWCSHLSRQLD